MDRPASLSSLRDCDHLMINWIKHHGHPDFRPPLSPCSETQCTSETTAVNLEVNSHHVVDLVPQLPSLAPATQTREQARMLGDTNIPFLYPLNL